MANLLLRGMLVGLVAGILCFLFLRIAGEPHVERAIAFEEARSVAAGPEASEPAMAAGHDHHMAGAAAGPAGHSHGDGEAALVSRTTQAGLGLFTATAVYGAALGGLFSLAFALVYGRWETLGPRGTSALLALVGFVALYLVPYFKYTPNPPAVGNADTIGIRTGLHLTLLVISLACMIGAIILRTRLAPTYGRWNATILAGAAYFAAMVAVGVLMPGIHEVPDTFPATTLWGFRIASLGGQAILWAVIGLGFGFLSHRVTLRERGARLDAAVV